LEAIYAKLFAETVLVHDSNNYLILFYRTSTT
jgi:hypothetical protein